MDFHSVLSFQKNLKKDGRLSVVVSFVKVLAVLNANANMLTQRESTGQSIGNKRKKTTLKFVLKGARV